MRALRLAPAILVVLAFADVARATEALPIIVTYEMKRQTDADLVQRRDPKEFWARQIMARLEENKPTVTLGRAASATARGSFVVGRDGRIVSQAIDRTSGIPAVDKAALAMLARAAPFAPMPAAITDTSLTFTLPLRFR